MLYEAKYLTSAFMSVDSPQTYHGQSRISVFRKNKKKTLKKVFFEKKNFMAPFYGWGSTASRLEPLREGSLLFTTKLPEIPGAHFIGLGRMKG